MQEWLRRVHQPLTTSMSSYEKDKIKRKTNHQCMNGELMIIPHKIENQNPNTLATIIISYDK